MREYNFVQIQEVPRGQDYAPIKTFFLWHVDHKQAHESVKDSVLMSILKMKKRIIAEKEKDKILLAKASEGGTLTSADKQKIANHNRVERVLYASIQKLAGIFVVLQYYYVVPTVE